MNSLRLAVALMLLSLPVLGLGQTASPEVLKAHALDSRALGRSVAYSLFVPPGVAPSGGWPLVVILHGDGRNHRSLADDARAKALIARQPFAVLCPNGDRAWWIDSPLVAGSHYQSMLRELLDAVPRQFPVSAAPAKTVIAGWSMGGFGAVRFAQDHRERIGGLAIAMALVDFPNPALPKEQNYGVPAVMADPARYAEFNCLTKAERLRGLPILQLAPVEAFDFTMNRNFHARLTELGIAHDYREIPGGHVWSTVSDALPALLEFAQKQFQPAR
ncbi:MAG: hypothetical protein H2172_14120 [Opitutus sp.]|nr:hypothetical protein [Opitutus sp.]MCS6247345.1 hypothetical protein [Opitutus sp.]MCS6275291.1 hypothetical protein [Opitutus sp.]MCS6277585.1 hypothetical protein [Opitutus sp.]MCS6300703.1 hypothetical protein [Opitutus sp.]